MTTKSAFCCPVCDQHVDKHTEAERIACKLWQSFDDNERYGVKFGLYPGEKMPKYLDGPVLHAVVVALMDKAQRTQRPGGSTAKQWE